MVEYQTRALAKTMKTNLIAFIFVNTFDQISIKLYRKPNIQITIVYKAI